MAIGTKITTLFISYNGLLQALRNGRIKVDDLKGGLFYFGCTRDYMLSDKRGDSVYQALRAALEAAEAQKRVVWRRSGQLSYWAQLNDLLKVNGLPVFSNTGRFTCTHQEMVDAVRGQGLPYRVVWTD